MGESVAQDALDLVEHREFGMAQVERARERVGHIAMSRRHNRSPSTRTGAASRTRRVAERDVR
jgi:hypothetical protein